MNRIPKTVKFDEPELEELLCKAQEVFKNYRGISAVEFLKDIRRESKVAAGV
jgi:hypothetical protein